MWLHLAILVQKTHSKPNKIPNPVKPEKPTVLDIKKWFLNHVIDAGEL